MVAAQQWLKIEYYINVDKDDCLIILHKLSDMLHIWDMYPTQCVVPLTVKERAKRPFSLLFAT